MSKIWNLNASADENGDFDDVKDDMVDIDLARLLIIYNNNNDNILS